jgi:hypothetical protein
MSPAVARMTAPIRTTGLFGRLEQHFELRRVALGDCFRPYGTPSS